MVREWLYEKLTGRPYWTGRSMAAEFGPPPASEFADDLSRLSDAEVLAFGGRIVAERRAARGDSMGWQSTPASGVFIDHLRGASR